MVKTPEEYFSELSLTDAPAAGGLTTVERAFVEKYLGVEALDGLPVVSPGVAQARGKAPATATSLRERLRAEAQVHLVSFYIREQLFLLPVAGIQEVLRHIELVKVPLAPPFVAGVINLRGRVTPLIHLGALLTAVPGCDYTERNFILVCGTEQLQLGLIIDRVNSMHMLDQDKITWNVETKLGEGAEYLCAVADLDDRVCGILAPETIIQKLLSH